MNLDERRVLRDWHDLGSSHTGAFRMCQEQPCLDLRRLQGSEAGLLVDTWATQGEVD